MRRIEKGEKRTIEKEGEREKESAKKDFIDDCIDETEEITKVLRLERVFLGRRRGHLSMRREERKNEEKGGRGGWRNV